MDDFFLGNESIHINKTRLYRYKSNCADELVNDHPCLKSFSTMTVLTAANYSLRFEIIRFDSKLFESNRIGCGAVIRISGLAAPFVSWVGRDYRF